MYNMWFYVYCIRRRIREISTCSKSANPRACGHCVQSIFYQPLIGHQLLPRTLLVSQHALFLLVFSYFDFTFLSLLDLPSHCLL